MMQNKYYFSLVSESYICLVSVGTLCWKRGGGEGSRSSPWSHWTTYAPSIPQLCHIEFIAPNTAIGINVQPPNDGDFCSIFYRLVHILFHFIRQNSNTGPYLTAEETKNCGLAVFSVCKEKNEFGGHDFLCED